MKTTAADDTTAVVTTHVVSDDIVVELRGENLCSVTTNGLAIVSCQIGATVMAHAPIRCRSGENTAAPCRRNSIGRVTHL